MPRFNSSAAGSGAGGAPSPLPTSPDQPADKKPAPDGPGVAPLPQQAPAKEEPDRVLESDIPLDGANEEGEAMIRDLPKNPGLSESPHASHTAHSKP